MSLSPSNPLFSSPLTDCSDGHPPPQTKKQKILSKKKSAWFTVKIENLKKENEGLQKRVEELVKENVGLKEQLNTTEAENQKVSELMAARTRELQASRALEHVRMTVSEADVVEYARRLNYTLHQTAALIVDSSIFLPMNVALIKAAETKLGNCFPPEDLEFLLSSQQTMTIQNVLQSRLGQFCVDTIRAWIFRNIIPDHFFEAMVNSMKASGPSFIARTWERLTRTHSKIPFYTVYIQWFSEILAEITVGILCAAGGATSKAEAERAVQENFMQSFQGIFKHCSDLDQAILDNGSVDLYFPQPGATFDPERMEIVVGEPMPMIAYTCNLGLQEKSDSPTNRALLKAGIIPRDTSQEDILNLESEWPKTYDHYIPEF